jgi:hypothetical protein
MNTASDRDHSRGRFEDQTVALCVSRARLCLTIARRQPIAGSTLTPAECRRRAREWIALGKARREADQARN